MTTANLVELVLLKEPAAIPRPDPKVARAYVRSLQQAVKAAKASKAGDLLVVARERFEIHSQILGFEISIQGAALLVSGSFVSAALHKSISLQSRYREIMPT
jgi:hypothetical protein